MRTASEKMEVGSIAFKTQGTWYLYSSGWFHAVVTLELSILVGAWKDGNGYEMLSTLYVYTHTSRIRYSERMSKVSMDGLIKRELSLRPE